MNPYQVAAGTGDLDFTTENDTLSSFRPSAIRIHFIGGAGTGSVVVSLVSVHGEEYNVTLFTVAGRGTGADLNLVWQDKELQLPSGWLMAAGDKIRIQWTNPDPGNMQYGLRFESLLSSKNLRG